MKRTNWTYFVVSAIALSLGISAAGARATHHSTRLDGVVSDLTGKGHPKHKGPGVTTSTTTTTATTQPTTTTSPPTTTTLSPTTTTLPPTTTTTIGGASCVGVPMTAGQADINGHGAGTTFCLSGTHNWTLTPKAGDRLIGPAILDGGNTSAHA